MPTHIRSHPRPVPMATEAAPTVGSNETAVDLRLQLTNRLQSSLDLLELLNHFFDIAQSLVASAGIAYQHLKKRIDLALGEHHKHRASYNLQIGRTHLGELSLSRNEPFTAVELSHIETLIGLLMLPLRNALLYRDALEHSLRDPLTGIGNRSALDAALKREFKLARRAAAPLSVVVADIDFFKQVNDSAGHVAGDLMIKKTAQIIAASVRQTDQVFRFGGEEFVVLLGGTEHAEALRVAERIRLAMTEMTLTAKSANHSLTMSLGVSTLRQHDSIDTLFERADDALYQAKAAGRNAVVSAEINTSAP